MRSVFWLLSIIPILSSYMKFMKIKRNTILFKSNTLIMIIKEICRLCKGGELFDEIISRTKFTEKDAAEVMH